MSTVGSGRTPTEWSKRLADALVKDGLITSEQATDALAEAGSRGLTLSQVLVEHGTLGASTCVLQLSLLSGVSSVDLVDVRPMMEAFRLVPEALARDIRGIGYRMERDRLTIACAEPIDPSELRRLGEFVGHEVAGCVLADPDAITRMIDTVYAGLETKDHESAGTDDLSSLPPPPPAAEGPGDGSSFDAAADDILFGRTPDARFEPVLVDSLDDDEEEIDRSYVLRGALDYEPEVRPFVPTVDSSGILDIDELLTYAVSNGASDLHLANQLPPAIRIDGSLRTIEGLSRLDNEQIREMIYRILTQTLRERFEAEKELDTSHTIAGIGRFRVNVFQQRGSIGSVMRAIPHDIPPFETLGLPPSIATLAELRRGLVLVTGPTGSGKSTTLASLVNIINRTKPLHIMTVEDPIEFLHTHNRSIVNQREVGVDTTSFAGALRYVLRQDPDVILVGEMRDTETIATALTAAETGHLVFATLHTQDAPQTVDRIIDVFPQGQQDQIRIQLASSLEAVVTQQLIVAASGFGRVAIAEVMMCTPAIRNLIRTAKTHQIYSLIQTGAAGGMQTMDQALARAVQGGIITEAIAFDRCHDPNELRDFLRAS